MANGTTSSSWKAKDDENNDLKGSENSGRKSVNSCAATAESSGVRRSPRETLSKEKYETQKKRRDARSYRALFTKPKKVDGTDRCNDLNGTDSGRKEGNLLEEFTERTQERTTGISTSQSAKEALEKNNEHKLFPTSQKNSCRDISSDGGDLQITKNGLVAGETNDDAETATPKNLQSQQLVNPIVLGGICDCGISMEMVPKVTPSKRKGHGIDTDSVASPKMSSKGIDICTGVGISLSQRCKRKDCTETCGMCSERPRVDCNSTKQDTCSSNMELNQFGSSDVKDRGKLDVGISTGRIEKPCNHIQQHIPSADLQTGCCQNTCIICGLDGKLLCCHGKGCKRHYHLSCLEPPLEEFPLGAWYCLECVWKKIESGIYSVSEGIEAIWDSKELEVSDDELQRQKEYFVKYKGLAHIHNRWVPENQVLLQAPSLIAKYNRKKQGAVWKQQWAVPRRLLQKRLFTIPKECDEHHNKGHDVDELNYHVEWLVKWCGLGYEHASWEFENASFFSCPEGQHLIREYETRKKAQRASKFDKERAVASLKISHLPAAVSSRLDANLDAVNKLCNHWHRGQNAIIFDDHERIWNVISSLLSLLSEVSRPFLIISSSTSEYSWDEEFMHLAPSVDVVVYSGSKEIRNSIRNLEFYDEGSHIMFQVLITSPEVISEDLNVLGCIGWEAVIVDECQRPRIGSCFEQIKMLTASKRLLIISNQLKDNASEYLNLLSLLDSQSDPNNSELTNSSKNIDTLKERLAMFVAYECKLESSRFLEYWVPVLLSNVQLEKYCFTLVSNSLSLCSPSKTDPVGVLLSILVSSRKCCDHPYDVDQSLQTLLTKGLQAVEFLEVGIKASGKLQLLDAMLLEIKKRELKVLILFQYIGGSGWDLMGDILDDFLRQRFGIDSYERVNNGVIPSKKQSALNRFNNERERFVFLLETRACLPSIKLSAVGTVIIFGSDWNPVNDLRALQRITLDSQFEQIKVFRLYSSFTVEEKLLILSKQEKTIDSNIENISPSSSHMLLKWGASYLFSELENFHDISTQDASTLWSLSQQSHLKDVIQEFSTILHRTGIDNSSKLSLILQAKQNQGTYRTEMPLFGEQKIQVMNGDPPHTFWTQLLEGKLPRWKYCISTSQRNRKRVQYFDDLQKEPGDGSAEVAKRRKKFVSDANAHPTPKAVLQEGELATGDWEGISETSAYDFTTFSRSVASEHDKVNATSTSLHQADSISKIPALKMVDWESRRKQCDLQKNLLVLWRPQIAKLCEVLHLKEDVKAMVERFHEYVMNNHLVNREPATTLQAFQISLCWSAAALLKQKLDHKESLALAKQHLGFTCKKEEADYVYLLLRCLKKLFLYRTGYLKVPNSPRASELSSKSVERDYSDAMSYQQNKKAKIEDLSGFTEGSDIHTISESGVAPEIQLAQREVQKVIKEIQKKNDKKMKKQIEKHKQEMEQFNQKYEEEKAQLENKKRTEAAVIRLHSNVSMRTDKLNNLNAEYARKFHELEQKMITDLKNLEASHVAAKNNILERQTSWVESFKSWAMVEFVKSPVSGVNLSEARCSGIFQSASGSEVRPLKAVHILDDEAMSYCNPVNKAGPFKENTEGASVECNLTANSGCVEEQAVSRDSCLKEKDSVDEISKGGVLEEVLSMRRSDEQISDGSKAIVSVRETVSLTDVLENLDSMEAPSLLEPSSEKNSDKSTLRKVDGETLRESVTIISSEGRENFVSLEASSSVAIHDESDLGKVVGPVPLKEPVVVKSVEDQEKLASAEALSTEKIPNGAALNNFDGEVHLGTPKTDSSGEGYESLPSFLVPSSEEVPGGTSLNTVNSELPLSRPEAVYSTEGQGNIMSANSSLEKQIPGEATLNVPDAETPKSTSEIATSCDGTNIIVCTKSSSSKEQIPDKTTYSMPAKEVPLAETEIAPCEVLEGGNVQRENDGTSPNENDQQDGVVCTVNRESVLREPSSDLVSTDVGSFPCASSEVQARCLPSSEMKNASQATEISPFIGAINETCNESNPDVTVVELTKQAQQLRSSESTSNLSPPDLPSVSGAEHPSNNEGQISNQSSQAPRLPVANRIDGVIDGLVMQASETRTAPTPSDASQAAEISPLNGALDETCNVSNADVTVVELTEQVQQLRSSESTSNLSPPDLPSVSGAEHPSNNEGQASNQSSQAPRQPVANHIDGVIDGLVMQASETRTAPTPSAASQAAEISPLNGALDETCNVSNPDVTVVELTDQVQQLRSSESTSNLSPPDLPSVSGAEHPSNNEGQTSNRSSQAPRQPVANHIDGVIDRLVMQASETRTAPTPSDASQAAEILPFNGALDETCNVSNPDVTVVELTEQVQQLRSSESTSNLSPPDLPSVSGAEHPSNNGGQTSNQSSQAPRQPVANRIDCVIDGLVWQASETRIAPTPSDASQAAEISPFNVAIDVTCNVSSPDVTVVELTEQVQPQLRCSESTSNLSPPDLPPVSGVEHSSNTESQTSNQSSQAPRQPVANHIDGVIDGLVRQASETRIAPIPSVSGGLPLQTAPAVLSRLPDDPLKIEIERIKNEKEQTTKIHEHTKLQLKLECDKEIEEAVAQIRRKYEVKLQEKVAEFLLQKKELDVYYDKVLLNKRLAEAFKSKCIDNRASCSAGAMPAANSSSLQPQLFQLSSQQMVQQPYTASGLPSTGLAFSMPTVSSAAVVNTHTMNPPLQVVNPSALFSSTPTRPPHISTISSSTGNSQIGTEIRTPAPHLQPFRPSSSISPSSLPLHPSGMSSQQVHNSNPAASMSLHQPYVTPLAHRQSSITGQSGRIQHEIARGLTAPPISRLRSSDVLMGVNNPSVAIANPPEFLLPDSSSRSATRSHPESRVPSSQSNTAQQSGGAIDIVCLSDDD